MIQFLQSLYHSHSFSTIHFVLIASHVTLALAALLLGPIPMIVGKGGKNHRWVGKAYLWSMVTSLVIATILLFFRFNVFLAGITALSLNSVVTGTRSLYRKRPEAHRYKWFDWGFAITILTAGIGLLSYGILTGLGFVELGIPSGSSLRIVLTILPIGFGIAIIGDSVKDLRSLYRPPTDRNWWWYYHMERMLGSYIALTTALMVQQVGPRMPSSLEWVAWVVPTAIGSPLIAIWIKRYRTKFTNRPEPRGQMQTA